MLQQSMQSGRWFPSNHSHHSFHGQNWTKAGVFLGSPRDMKEDSRGSSSFKTCGEEEILAPAKNPFFYTPVTGQGSTDSCTAIRGRHCPPTTSLLSQLSITSIYTCGHQPGALQMFVDYKAHQTQPTWADRNVSP